MAFYEAQAPWRNAMAWFGLVVTCAAHTDLVPFAVRDNFIFPYFTKAVPSIILGIITFIKPQCIKPTAVINNARNA